ncbi:hypothetical protein HDU67_003609 [Dinochytrium kinnereticum]|nr:hypothetical protein HDU67_003609 [Dinochytrium kinnereticum]
MTWGNDASAIPESEEDIESGATAVAEVPTASALTSRRNSHDDDEDEPSMTTTIPFNYSLLSQLVTGESANSSEVEEDKAGSKRASTVSAAGKNGNEEFDGGALEALASIHMGNNTAATPEQFDYPVLPPTAAAKGPEFVDTSVPRKKI